MRADRCSRREDLSWGRAADVTVLFVLWIWGDQQIPGTLAGPNGLVGVTKGTPDRGA